MQLEPIFYILIIFIPLVVMEHHRNKLSWPRGELKPCHSSQSTVKQGTRPPHIPKNGFVI